MTETETTMTTEETEVDRGAIRNGNDTVVATIMTMTMMMTIVVVGVIVEADMDETRVKTTIIDKSFLLL